jgi:uncharacterized repeat protein (TIGR03806 family)
MTIAVRRLCVASLFTLAGGFLSSSGLAQSGLKPTPVGAFLNGAFPKTSPGTSPDAKYVQADYYPGLTFVEPLRIVEHPVEDRLIIVGKDGKAWSVAHSQGATDKKPFFDIGPIMSGISRTGEGGISDLVFHPEFGRAGSPNAAYVYISYRWSPVTKGTFAATADVKGYNRVSRFTVKNGQVDLSTELVLISQYDRQQWHIGLALLFGTDGFLYISTGDEGNCCNRLYTTQRLDGGLWSGILRIDVDKNATRSHPIRRQPTHLEEKPSVNGANWPDSATQGYFIPNDNPFLDAGGGKLEEFYSIGLRHPWTMSFDPLTNNLWVADVGQSTREEIDIIHKGDNHQWGYTEGTTNGVIPKPATIIGTEVKPIWDYDHTTGKAVIGAGVYRGNQFPELYGKYIFSDFGMGALWTATPESGYAGAYTPGLNNGAVFANGGSAHGNGYRIDKIGQLTSGFPNGINSYLLDKKGNILLAKSSGPQDPGGKIQRLARSADSPAGPEPPKLLSATAAFTDLAKLTTHAGCIPFALNVPFWSDHAIKTRWMCVPNDGTYNTPSEQVVITSEGDWQFPVGTVMIKHFEMLTDTADPNSAVRLETRFIVHGEDTYYGVTYRWNQAGTDAELQTSGSDLNLNIKDANGSSVLTWHFPGRDQCLTCHGSVHVGTLGPKSRQMNRDFLYATSGIKANQIETLNTLGVLSPATPPANIPVTSTPTDDCAATIEARGRSYIDSNCAYCHRPMGVRANFDARLTTPLAQSNMIDGPLVESLGIVGEAPLVKGSLMQSVMYHDANSAGQNFSMPPLAKNLIDKYGMVVFAAWIEALGTGNEDQPSPAGCNGPGAGGAGTGTGTGAGGGAAGDGMIPPSGAGGSDGLTPGPDGPGCGCRVGHAGAKPKWLGGLLMGAALVVRRRRRSRA